MDEADHDDLAYLAFSSEHRQQLCSMNPLEQLHAEIKSPADVVDSIS